MAGRGTFARRKDWHLRAGGHPGRNLRSARHGESLRSRLAADGVETMAHYPIAVHRSEAYAGLGWKPGAFPLSERLAAEVLSLPIGPHLAPDQAEAVRNAAG